MYFTDQVSHTQCISQIRFHVNNVFHRLGFTDFFRVHLCVSGETSKPTLSVQRFDKGAVTVVVIAMLKLDNRAYELKLINRVQKQASMLAVLSLEG